MHANAKLNDFYRQLSRHVEKLSNGVKQTSYYNAVVKNCSFLQTSFWLLHEQTGTWYAVDEMKMQLLQAESDLRKEPTKEKTKGNEASHAMAINGTCFVCGKVRHRA